MNRARNTQPNRTTSPFALITNFASSLGVPQLCVIVATLALLAIGLVMVFSASSITLISGGESSFKEIGKQLLFAVLGLAGCCGAAFFGREETLRGVIGWAYYGVCVILLLATAAFGTTALGAQRWLVIGGVSIQVSEFIKIAFVIVTANLICQYKEGRRSSMEALVGFLLLVLVPLAFLFLFQSDLGTTMICGVSLFALLALSDVVRMRVLFILMGIAILVGVVAICSSSYRMARLTGFIDPWADADDSGYQLIHSYKALAAGGLFGVGIGNSYQKALYLPEAETDFIFAIVGEELGLVGAVAVVLLFVLLLRGGLRIAQESSSFGCMVAGSLTTMIVFQAFLNIFCVIGLAPVTGKPLPFISSGGSSLISSLLVVGIILAMSMASGGDVHEQRRGNLRVISADDRMFEPQESLRGRSYARSSEYVTPSRPLGGSSTRSPRSSRKADPYRPRSAGSMGGSNRSRRNR